MDVLSELVPNQTPYRYGFNNPVFWKDPSGLFETYAKAAKFISDNGINGSIELLVDGDPTQGYTVRVIGGEFDGDVFYDHSSPLVFSNKASGGANSGKSSESGIDWAGIGRTAADFTPILGGCLDCYEGYQNGDGMQIAMGVVSLIADGVTLGGSSLLKGAVKTGIKQGSKQLAKKAAKEVYSTSKVYPNQLNQLKSINELKRDDDIIPEIKDLYNKVTKDEIREDLVYKEFNEFVAEDRFINSEYLTNRIEEIFFNTDIRDINEHPFKDDILKIISKLSDSRYKDLFQILDREKAKLMLDVVTNENTKDDIFSIVTLKEYELKKLGKLVQEDNFSALLDKATDLLQQQIETEADFRHKHEIGTYIERLIRKKLSEELQGRVSFNKESVETTNIQGGQDIIVLLDENPIYFIEVKSRWNSQNSVSMSKLQLQRAVEENERYALCTVDITRYTGENDRYKLSTDEILPLTKFVTNIGNTIKPLIEDNLEAEKEQEKSIHLIDYRGIIPQDIIQSGKDFNNFIVLVSETINRNANVVNV